MSQGKRPRTWQGYIASSILGGCKCKAVLVRMGLRRLQPKKIVTAPSNGDPSSAGTTSCRGMQRIPWVEYVRRSAP
jgi:hypothetical protein